MQTKPKQCSRCSKLKPIFKNKTIEGVKSSYCQTCWNIVNKEQAKEKRKKIREKKREIITEKNTKAIRIYKIFFSIIIEKLNRKILLKIFRN